MKTPLYLFLVAILCSFSTIGQEAKKYDHILITNDDGIDDADRLLALAKSVNKVASRVSIIVSSFDRSGTSNYTTFGKHQSTIEIKCRYKSEEENIAAYTISGNPADCVFIGLNGLFPDDRPDLVLSGINGGANIGPRWFISGTVGAIRMAAYLGVRGIALSGFDDDDERSFEVIPDWVTQLISSDIVDDIGKNGYLTIGFPDVPLQEIKGVKVANRRVSFDRPESMIFYQVVGDDPYTPENKTIWTIKYLDNLNDSPDAEYDDIFLEDGYIIITPMTIDENNSRLNSTIQAKIKQIPPFSLKE